MRFYHLERFPEAEHLIHRTDYIITSDANVGDAPRCPICGRFTGMRMWLPPYQVELDCWGKAFGDMVLGTASDDILVSQRFKSLWEEQGLSGLSGFEPVEVLKVKRRKAKGDPPRYFKAKVERSWTALDHKASGTVWGDTQNARALCAECRQNPTSSGVEAIERVIIEPGTWRGEDLFVPRGLPDFLASERFNEFRDAYGIANAVLIPAEEYSFDFRLPDTGP